jgi:hypothetical protein
VQVHRINEQNAAPAGPHYNGPNSSIFDTANETLRNMGVPSWNLGPYPVEPIASVGFVASLLLFGLRGLLFSGLLFGIVKWSQSRGGSGRSGNASGRNRSDNNRPGHRELRSDGHVSGNISASPSNPRSSQGGWPQDGGYRLGRT